MKPARHPLTPTAGSRFGPSLAHPLALVAAATLLLNALVFQRWWPAWWTGKLGDLAWLALVPLLVASLLQALPARWGLTPRRAHWLALALTGGGFALVKTVPAANTLAVAALARVGYGAKLALDPTDLLALPGLALAWLIWQRPAGPLRRPAPRWLRAAGLGLALVALVADSAGAINLGVECVGHAGADLIAVTSTTPAGYFSGYTLQVLKSTDGGLTWSVDSTAEVSLRDLQAGQGPTTRCDFEPWPLSDPQTVDRFYTWVKGQGLYLSTDGGQTLTLDLPADDLPATVSSAVVDETTGNLVLAVGVAGLAVRLPDGAWQIISVPLGPGREP